MASYLYTLVIYPLQQIIEFVYMACIELCKSSGLAILGVSAAVTLFCLPLYDVAEKWQRKEREIQEKLKPGIKRIKETFFGDEQYMILSTFYRQNHYHPLMALRSSFGLFIQIPFFIAAYNFLSNNEEIRKASFFFIQSLGLPDGLFKIGSVSINVLPVLMTIINMIAGAVYTKGFAFREKLQINVMALVFLVILYRSPSGLVLYWTMNNVFSLVKNIFYRLKNPGKIFRLLMAALLFFTALFILFTMKPKQAVPVFLCSIVVFFLPVLKKLYEKLLCSSLSKFEEDSKFRTSVFFVSAISLTILTGIVIPSFLITSSTQEFCYIDNCSSPLYFLFNSLLQCTGLFLLWPTCIYFLFDRKVQGTVSFVSFLILVFGIINAFCFQGNYGTVSATLVFTEHKELHPDMKTFILNLSVLLLSAGIILLAMNRKKSFIISWISFILLISMGGLSVINCMLIQREFLATAKPDPQVTDIKPVMSFSKSGKNVLVIMLDKAPGFYMSTVFNEAPELLNSFSGFTAYPDTVSFGSWTIQGAPGLYGGYEYTPWEMNQRREIPMQEKHNQALSMLAFMFEKNGFESYLIDPPYPNYDTEPVFSFLDGHKNVHGIKALARYTDIWYRASGYPKLNTKSRRIKRNFIWFSIFRIVPPSMRSIVHYNDWWSETDYMDNVSDFIDRYSVLDFLPELTSTDSDKNCFIFMDNEATHDPGFVMAPDYTPAVGIPNSFGFKHTELECDPGFHAMTASLKRLGEWFDYLKENNVYDNTRIIIVSDHGSYQRFPIFEGSDLLPRAIEWYNPMLMVKDFNAAGNLKYSGNFMTQADVPAIAVKNVIKEPVNPFTGNEIKELSLEEKQEKTIVSFSKANRVRATEDNGFIINDDDWYTVKNSIFSVKNWSKLNVKKGEIVK